MIPLYFVSIDGNWRIFQLVKLYHAVVFRVLIQVSENDVRLVIQTEFGIPSKRILLKKSSPLAQ